MASGHGSDVFHHVRDALVFELPKAFGGEVHIPQPFAPYFAITKFMILETVALLLAIVIFRGLARRIATGEPVRGAFWNFWESIALFLRDQLVRPSIGDGGHGHDDHGHGHDDHGHAAHGHDAHGAAAKVSAAHPADQYLPFIWSVFFFILFNNLLGAIPWLGSPTGNIWVTGVLAVGTFAYVIYVGSKELGAVGFWKGLVPSMDLPGPMKLFVLPLMWVIEFVGLIIKHGVLAVRLFANIMAGHTVIAVMLSFIGAVGGSSLYYVVAPASVLGQVGIGLLELFVAFLQAYVFAFLATLFIGSAVHPH
jgi:F-type H+-transporting ATPase subunit a